MLCFGANKKKEKTKETVERKEKETGERRKKVAFTYEYDLGSCNS